MNSTDSLAFNSVYKRKLALRGLSTTKFKFINSIVPTAVAYDGTTVWHYNSSSGTKSRRLHGRKRGTGRATGEDSTYAQPSNKTPEKAINDLSHLIHLIHLNHLNHVITHKVTLRPPPNGSNMIAMAAPLKLP